MIIGIAPGSPHMNRPYRTAKLQQLQRAKAEQATPAEKVEAAESKKTLLVTVLTWFKQLITNKIK